VFHMKPRELVIIALLLALAVAWFAIMRQVPA
jgi:hypothetical protein